MYNIFFNDEPWFAVKKFGYGSGLPISWKGWVFLLSFIILAIAIGLILGGNILIFLPLLLTITVPFIYIAKRKTNGNWKWRLNGKDQTDKL